MTEALIAPAPEAKKSSLQEVWSFIKTLVVLVAIAFCLRATVVEAFKIPSGSMIPTLLIGDHLLVSKVSYGLRLPFITNSIYDFAQPKRGDIVVFTRPDDPATSDEDESSINLIKRVIGLPGDRIEIRGTKLLINNEVYQEPYARYELGGEANGVFGPVPDHHVFLLGDNRDHSKDSRFWNNPFINMGRIKGRALIIYLCWGWDNLDRIGTIIK